MLGLAFESNPWTCPSASLDLASWVPGAPKLWFGCQALAWPGVARHLETSGMVGKWLVNLDSVEVSSQECRFGILDP